jgi:hypothetical protein
LHISFKKIKSEYNIIFIKWPNQSLKMHLNGMKKGNKIGVNSFLFFTKDGIISIYENFRIFSWKHIHGKKFLILS